MRCAARPLERFGDVELSVQASRFHASQPGDGCGHTPLELYDRVEVALRWVSTRSRAPRWIRQPSHELGLDGFDDLRPSPDEVPIAEYVPQGRVLALRAALAERARSREGQTPELEMEAAPDCELAPDALRVVAVDTPPIDREQPGAGIASL